MLHAVLQDVQDVKDLLLSLRDIAVGEAQHCALSPLVELLQPVQQAVHSALRGHQPPRAEHDLQRVQAVGRHVRVRVGQQHLLQAGDHV